MAKKLKRSIFAWIKDDWQKWGADKNVVKKIFWFLWLLIWTILRGTFWFLTILFRAIAHLYSIYRPNASGKGNCRDCRHYDGRICSVTNTERYEGSGCPKFSFRVHI